MPASSAIDSDRRLESLPEVHRSVAVPDGATWLRKMVAFSGPGYLVAVGYMDPGNWATALAGGSAFGYSLLWVILAANLIAMLLQALAARVGIATGRDLAQHCRERYPRPVALALWGLAELAICATDLAELIGTAIALKLLFGLPLAIGVCLTAADVLLILALQGRGFRWLEAFVMVLIATIGACFAWQVAASSPDWGAVAWGLVPNTATISDPAMLYVAIGILGATVMPHNLYLHSAVVQTRRHALDENGRREAIRFATIDSTVALVFAFVINAAILVLAASVFHSRGYTEIAEIQDAHRLLAPLLGVPLASTLFALALLASGQNSTLTGTLAGQVVMEGFLDLRLPPWLRRLVTRLIAIVPAIVVAVLYGESGTAKLLVASQVVLSLQLPFAVIPLLRVCGDRSRMGKLVAGPIVRAIAWAAALAIIALNAKLIADFVFAA